LTVINKVNVFRVLRNSKGKYKFGQLIDVVFGVPVNVLFAVSPTAFTASVVSSQILFFLAFAIAFVNLLCRMSMFSSIFSAKSEISAHFFHWEAKVKKERERNFHKFYDVNWRKINYDKLI